MPGVRGKKRAARKQDRRRDVHVSEVRVAGDGAHAERHEGDQLADHGAGADVAAELAAGAELHAGDAERSVVDDQLEAQARELDERALAAARDPAGVAAAAPAPLAPADFDCEARELVDELADALGDWFPSTRKTYDLERRVRLAARAAPVLRKHNLSAAVLFGRWGAEILLAASLSRVIKPTWDAIAYDLKHPDGAERTDAPRSSEPAPASREVPPGQAPDPFAGRKI